MQIQMQIYSSEIRSSSGKELVRASRQWGRRRRCGGELSIVSCVVRLFCRGNSCSEQALCRLDGALLARNTADPFVRAPSIFFKSLPPPFFFFPSSSQQVQSIDLESLVYVGVADSDPNIVILTTVSADGRLSFRLSHVYMFK